MPAWRTVRAIAVGAAIAVFTPVVAHAQADGPIRQRVVAESGRLQLQIGDLLDPELRSVLEDGFPLRIGLTITLWSDRFFDERMDTYEWRASARREGGEGAYRLEVSPDSSESGPVAESGSFESMADLTARLSREMTIPLDPGSPGRFYYFVELTVQSLSASDLDELDQWLRGQPDPVPEADERGALSRGAQRLFVRALGLPSRSLERRTRTFVWTPRR